MTTRIKLRINAFQALLLLVAATLAMQAARIKASTFYLVCALLACVYFLAKSKLSRDTAMRAAGHANYLLFVLFIWFLSPWLRRIGDFRNGWDDRSLYLLAPIACTLVCTLFIRPTQLRTQPNSFLLLMVPALVVPYVIGVATAGLLPATFALLNWLTPLLFALYLATNHACYAQFRQSLRQAFMVGALLMSGYGIYQFVAPPPWDLFWIENVPMTSVGLASAGEFRVFSTMNSPMVFAPVLASAILVLLAVRHKAMPLVIFVSCIALLLTSIRAAWGGLVVGLAVLFLLQAHRRITSIWRPLALAVIAALSFGFILLYTPYGERIQARLETIYTITSDTSFNDRIAVYEEGMSRAQQTVFGEGLGTIGKAQALSSQPTNAETTFDSGILQIPISLGWIFGSWYTLMLLAVVFYLSRDLTRYRDEYFICYFAIIVSTIVQMVFSNRLSGPAGFFFFLFLGIFVCGRKYYAESLAMAPA